MAIFTTIFEVALMVWYFYSLYDVAIDPTIDNFWKKLFYEFVNVLIIGLLFTTIFKNNYNIPFVWVGLVAFIAWYFVSTYIDATNNGYSKIWKAIYVGIDISTMFYLFGTIFYIFFGSKLVSNLLIKTIAVNCKNYIQQVFA